KKIVFPRTCGSASKLLFLLCSLPQSGNRLWKVGDKTSETRVKGPRILKFPNVRSLFHALISSFYDIMNEMKKE
ncbi:hypothetical protein, partial [Streptococcus acidominimus]|uniref:hypothetical protein n=1 Tax=Streptococcus acidominimus TaxID=1326 RepID=UPI001D16E643